MIKDDNEGLLSPYRVLDLTDKHGFLCGKLLGDKYEEFEQRVRTGEEPKRVLDEFGIKRYCCRSTMLTSIDLTGEIAKFKR